MTTLPRAPQWAATRCLLNTASAIRTTYYLLMTSSVSHHSACAGPSQAAAPAPRDSDGHPAHRRAKRRRENSSQARRGAHPQVPCPRVGFRPSSPKIRISMTRNSSSRRPIWIVGHSRPGAKVRTRELSSKTEAKSASMASRDVGKSTPGEGRKPNQPFIFTESVRVPPLTEACARLVQFSLMSASDSGPYGVSRSAAHE